MGTKRAHPLAGGNPVFAYADVDLVRARDGALPRMPALSRLRDTSLLCAGTNADRNAGSIHPHQVADQVTAGVVRHRDRWADRRIRFGCAGDGGRIDAVQALARAGGAVGAAVQLAADLSAGALGDSVSSLPGGRDCVSSSCGRSVGGDVHDSPESSTRWAARWRAHRLRCVAEVASPHLSVFGLGIDPHGAIFLGRMAGVGSDPNDVRNATSDGAGRTWLGCKKKMDRGVWVIDVRPDYPAYAVS